MLSMDFILVLIHSLSYLDFKGGEIATTLTAKFGGANYEEDNLESLSKDTLTHSESSSDNEGIDKDIMYLVKF